MCNSTTTAGYLSVPLESKIKEITFQKIVKSSDNKQWMETVEEELEIHRFQLYLDGSNQAKTDPNTSTALVVKLLNALEGSDYSYLSKDKKKGSFADVWKLIKTELTNKTAIYSETLAFWKCLFQNQANSRDKFASYYNIFKTNVHKLHEYQSKAVTDDIFLRASL